MNQKSFFGKSLTFLIVAVLIVTAFIRGTVQVWCYACIFSVWGIVLITRFILSKKGVLKAKLRKLHKSNKKVTLPPNMFEVSDISDSSFVLLRHVNHRISAYLKSVYPSITWEWVSEEPERIAVEGGTGKIKLFGISDFNYADIILDQMGRVDCKMVKIVPLAELQGAAGSSENVNPSAGQPDPEAWYNIQGKKVLESCVGDLHSRGIASLTIKENGDICVRQADQEFVHDKFKNFPTKGVWQGLIKVFENNGLSALIKDNTIKISW